MPAAYLQHTYPHLAHAWASHARLLPRDREVPLAVRPLGETLLREMQEGAFQELGQVETAAHTLLAAGWREEDLDEQYRFLISRRETHFRCGLDEILALGHLQAVGALAEIGFGPLVQGSPGLDGAIRLPDGALCGVDVKTTGGEAQRLFDQILTPALQAWVQRHGHDAVSYTMDVRGPLTQTSVGPATQEIAQQWTTFLDRTGPRLPTTECDLQIGPHCVVTVQVVERGRSRHVGISGVRRHADVVEATLLDHIEDKANHGEPFLLMYVRRFMSPMADLQPEPLRTLLTRIHRRLSRAGRAEHRLWLGVLYLDFVRFNPTLSLYARFNAAWPGRNTPYGLTRALNASRWVTRRR